VRLTTYSTAGDFLSAVRPTLAEHEAEHHLVLGVAEALVTVPPPNGELFAVSIDDENGLVLAAIMTARRPVLIASDRHELSAAAALLWSSIGGARMGPSHVIGGVEQMAGVVDAWRVRSGRPASVAMNQRVYKLTSVDPVAAVSGELRRATTADAELLMEWITAFELEALASVLPQSPRGVAERRIAAGELFLWCDPEPRTMAGWARPTSRAVAVNGVYTPAAWRGRGYATACVAELSAALLRKGFEFCVLYTDLANPTSNAIYSRIGYRPVRDFVMYALG